MGPPTAVDGLRKGLAMGATRAIHVADEGLAGSDVRATVDVLAAVLRTLVADLILTGADSSDGAGGVVGAALAARLDLPYLSYASEIEPAPDGSSVRTHRLSATGYDVLEAPTPAVVMGTQVLGEPRYPSLRGIMAARSKEIANRTLADLGIEPASVGAAAATTRVLTADPPPARAGAQVIRAPADEAVPQIVAFLAGRRLV
jgi:electron transfer flavoprotein beta subunit